MLTPKDLVVFVDEEQGPHHRLAFAVALAESWGAHLIVTFVANPLAFTPSESFAVGAGLESLSREQQERIRAAEAHTRQVFETLARGRHITTEWRLLASEVEEESVDAPGAPCGPGDCRATRARLSAEYTSERVGSDHLYLRTPSLAAADGLAPRSTRAAHRGRMEREPRSDQSDRRCAPLPGQGDVRPSRCGA